MDNENENLNSLNEEKDVIDLETIDDISVLKEGHTKLVDYDKFKKVDDANKQLFVRTKKAEGFELKDGKWIKSEPVKKPDAIVEPKKSDELEYGQLAFHNSKSDSVKIEHPEDVEFLRNTIKETGKSQDYILNSKWFNSELKERQDARIAKKGVPEGSKRSGISTKNDVDYWLNKGELPPNTPENRQLRIDIVNAKLAAEKAKKMFQG